MESQDNENVQKNLFRLFCAITNVPFNQREQSRYLDDRLLITILQSVDDNLDERQLLAAQVQAIKTIISRPKFSLTEKQTRLIRPFLLKRPPDPTSLKLRDLKDLMEYGRSFMGLGEEGLIEALKFWTKSVGDFLES